MGCVMDYSGHGSCMLPQEEKHLFEFDQIIYSRAQCAAVIRQYHKQGPSSRAPKAGSRT